MFNTQILLIIITATLFTLSGCGGGSEGETNVQPVPQPEPEPVQRPYRLFNLSQEELLRTTFFEITEEHIYEFTVVNPSKVNIRSEVAVRGFYAGGLGSWSKPIFTIFDENNNVINTFGGGYEFQTYNVDLGIFQPGDYYVLASLPLEIPTNKKLSSTTDGGYYNLFVTYYTLAEDIHGTEGIDLIRGDNSNQTIYGYSGNDIIYGEGGNDIIYGSVGDDNIYGQSGNDIIYGNEGNDIIHGGIGADELIGGEGQDIFVYVDPEESTFNLTERDTILDFNIIDDFIDISRLPEWNSNYTYRPSNYFNGSEPNVDDHATLWFVDGALYGKRGYFDRANPSYDFVIELEGVSSLPAERIIFP